MTIDVEYVEANDILGKYRFATKDMAAVGQFEHADTLEEIEQRVRYMIVLRLTDMDYAG